MSTSTLMAHGTQRRARKQARPHRAASPMQPYPRETGVLLDIPPRVQVDVYDNLIVLTKRINGVWFSYPVDEEALSKALARLPMSSGLLPSGTLATGYSNGKRFYVVYRPPEPVTLTINTHNTIRTQTLTAPPLIWAGCGRDYRIWALDTDEYPTGGERLMVAPFPNVYSDGRICWGAVDVRSLPEASERTMWQVFDMFMTGSYFNTHLANGKSVCEPTSVLAVYPSVNGRYPLDDLVTTTGTLEHVVQGKWVGGQL